MRQWIVLSVVLTVLGSSAVAVWLRTAPAVDLRTRGLDAMQSGRTAIGETLLEQHLETVPDDHVCRMRLADSYARKRLFESAVPHLKRLTDVPEFRTEALRLLAGIHLLREDTATAEETLLKILAIAPSDQAASLALGELYFNQGQAAKAIPLVRTSLETRPDRVESWLLLADALNDAGRTQEMIEPLRACLSLSPSHLTARANLAYALQSAGQCQEAEEQAVWCLERQPQLHRVRLILAQAQRDLGQPDKALESARHVLQHEPRNLEAAMLEADLLLYRNEVTGVYEKLVSFYDAHRSDRSLVAQLLRAAIAKQDHEAAETWKKALAELLPPK